MLVLFVGMSPSNVLFVLDFDCANHLTMTKSQDHAEDNDHIHVWKNFMAKLGASPISCIVQMFLLHIVNTYSIFNLLKLEMAIDCTVEHLNITEYAQNLS